MATGGNLMPYSHKRVKDGSWKGLGPADIASLIVVLSKDAQRKGDDTGCGNASALLSGPQQPAGSMCNGVNSVYY